MSTNEDSMDQDHPPRTRATSVSELMRNLSTTSPGAPMDGTTIGECYLDVLCVKYSGKSAGLTIYEDSLRTNIIGEFSLKEFLKENQVRSPVVRTENAEVQEINRVSYRSSHSMTKIGKKWIPVTARLIPGVALPLLVGMNFRDGHAECPTMQRQVNDINAPRIFFFFERVRLPSLISL